MALSCKPKRLPKYVVLLVADGRYLSVAEVIREGLRLLQEEVKWRADIRRKVADGLAQAYAGSPKQELITFHAFDDKLVRLAPFTSDPYRHFAFRRVSAASQDPSESHLTLDKSPLIAHNMSSSP